MKYGWYHLSRKARKLSNKMQKEWPKIEIQIAKLHKDFQKRIFTETYNKIETVN